MSRTVLSFSERSSFLHERNPAVKLAVTVLIMAATTMLFDPYSIGSLTLLGILTATTAGQVPLRVILRSLVPFTLFGSGFFLMNVMFPREAGEILVRIGPVAVSREGLATGTALGLRALCFGIWSMLFVATTDPVLFTVSLVRQLRVSPRIAYAALAAFRFLPLFEEEYRTIRAAHALRGVGEGEGLRGVFRRAARYTVPLVARAVRNAGRVAVAMESRGFTGSRERTFLHAPALGSRDLLFFLAASLSLATLLVFWKRMGLLRLWGGGLF